MTPQTLPTDHVFAVITGDIIGSTKLSPAELKKVRETIAKSVSRFVVRTDPLNKNVEFFRGDSWQVLLANPCFALNLTLLIQANLRASTNAQTRASIGVGTADGLENNVATSTGEAFTLSGRALENIPSSFRITGAIPRHADPTEKWFPGLLHLCSALARNWTQRQAETLGLWLSLQTPSDAMIAHALTMRNPSYEIIAKKLTITKQSIGDILTSANLPALREAMAIFHSTNWQRIAGPQKKRNV